ncbi:MAG: hypothetical protein EOP53_11260 [Sphingobacteriales bacterium]|nr:MAG: hypothetical protein EOP53_11260 [Sphingobacteriales bacterium]
MKTAGILLMIAGSLLLLAFLFQIPLLIILLKNISAQKSDLFTRLFYNLLLLAGGIVLIMVGNKVRKSSIS